MFEIGAGSARRPIFHAVAIDFFFSAHFDFPFRSNLKLTFLGGVEEASQATTRFAVASSLPTPPPGPSRSSPIPTTRASTSC